MSLIHIARHGQSLGSFHEEEVREGLSSQRFFKEDLVWKDGMSDWKSLEEMMDAWGWNHAFDTEEPPSCVEPAWERCCEVGFFQALLQTIKAVLFHPGKTFSKMKPEDDLRKSLGFYIMMNFVVMVILLSFQVPQILKNPELVAPTLVGVSHSSIIIGFVIFALISPILFAVGLFLSASIIHLSLKIVGAARQPWAATCRAFSYGFGAPAFFQLFPFGGVITFIWGFIITFLGLKKINESSTAHICFAAVVTFILFIFVGIAFIFGVGVLAHFHPEYFQALKKS